MNAKHSWMIPFSLLLGAWIGTPQARAQTPYYRGINLGGSAVTIDGRAFVGMSQAQSSGFNAGTYSSATSSVAPVPAVDAAKASMLNSAIWRKGVGAELNVSQSGLAKQTYQVFLYVLENYASNFRALNVWLEGNRVATGIGTLPRGEWRRYGPYSASVTDGALNLKIKSSLGDPHLMGLEIIAGTPPTTQTPTPTPAPVSNTAWKNIAIEPQSALFTAEYDSVPSAASVDAVTGFSNGAADAFADTAVAVRFNPSGQIDVRNGGGYASASTLSYAAGKSYHFKLVVDVAKKSYSVYVTPAGGLQQQLASNYAFRTEQSAASLLNNLGIIALSGTHSISNLKVTGGGTTTASPSPSASPYSPPPPSPSPSANPPPPTGPTPSDANILYYDNMESAAWSQHWGEQGCRPDSVMMSSSVGGRKGGNALRFEVRKSDFDSSCVTQERAEVLQLFDLPSAENEFWYSMSRYFPADYAWDPMREVIVQWHQGSGRSPPVGVYLENDQYTLNLIWDFDTDTTKYGGYTAFPLGKAVRGQWTDWVFHIRISQTSNGLVDVYQNGQLIQHYAGPIGYAGKGHPDMKFGIYKWIWKDPAKRALSPDANRILYVDEVRVGNKNARLIDMMPR